MRDGSRHARQLGRKRGIDPPWLSGMEVAIQDNGRGILVGWRTMGAGGNVVGWEAGSYSLGSMTVTESLSSRDHLVHTKEYPAAPYIENIGVYPDVWLDYMTRDNLARSGQAFVDAFVASMVNYIQIQPHSGSGQ